jgi:hypothetical protein
MKPTLVAALLIYAGSILSSELFCLLVFACVSKTLSLMWTLRFLHKTLLQHSIIKPYVVVPFIHFKLYDITLLVQAELILYIGRSFN